MDILTYNLDQLERWFLMLFRIGSMTMVMPFFGYRAVPVQIRIATAFMITVVLFPLHPHMQLILGPGVLYYIGAILKEVVIGLSIGLVTTFLFYGFEFAGHVMGHMMGFAIINVVDPQSESQMPVLGQVLNMLVLMLFLIIGGHHFLLQAINESFVRIPVGGGKYDPALVAAFARMSSDIFIIGVRIGAPVLVSLLVVEFALGIVARTVPQMNVWLIGFPLKISVGLLFLSLSLPLMVYMFVKLYGAWQGNVIDFIITMATG